MHNPCPDLVQQLIAQQFPIWQDLPVTPIAIDGWDNRTFHLGREMLVRMPSQAVYAPQVLKEQEWLPKLSPKLPLIIPQPIALGKPALGYPWPWSIYRWIEGEPASQASIIDKKHFTKTLSKFLNALHKIPTEGAPEPGKHNFYRGGDLAVYDAQARSAIENLDGIIDSKVALSLWENSKNTRYAKAPVWVHGDLTLGNLLLRDEKLCAVIDFGLMAVGDPACDFVLAWTFLDSKERIYFREYLGLDWDTWWRSAAWALWKAAIILAGLSKSNALEMKQSKQTLDAVLSDWMRDV